MNSKEIKKRLLRQSTDRQLIFEAIEASMALCQKKGPHDLEPGCNCISCINKRKDILFGPLKPLRYRI